MQRAIVRKPPQSVVDIQLDSTAGITLDRSLSEAARTVSLTAATAVDNVSMVHLDFVALPSAYGTKYITPNTDGTLTVTENVTALRITCMGICRYANADNVVLGIGIGDPAILPSAPGTSTDTLPAGTYVSRFRDARKGQGSNHSVTLKTPYFPVGKELELSALAGDKIFPVMWTEEGDGASVKVDDFIFVVEAIKR